MSRRNARSGVGYIRPANTPPVTDGMRVYWDPEYTAGITNVSGATDVLVSRVGGHSITAAGATNRPTHSAINGRYLWTFDGTNDVLLSTTSTYAPLFNALAPFTRYTYCDPDSAVPQMSLFGTSDTTGAGGSYSHTGLQSGGSGMFFTRAVGGAATGNTDAVLNPTTGFVLTEVYDGSTVSTFVNDTARLAAASNTRSMLAQTQFSMGALILAGANSVFWNGKIGKVIDYGAAHDATTRGQMVAYLRGFYGV